MSTSPISAFLLFISILCTAAPCLGASSPLVLRTATEFSPLSGHIDILEDTLGTLTINQVVSPEYDNQFKPDTRAVPNFGISKKVYWVRWTVRKEAAAADHWLLELDFPHMDYLDLYVPHEDGSFDIMQAGDMRSMSLRRFRHRNPVFPLDQDVQDATYYLRVDAKGRTVLPLTVWTPEAFTQWNHNRDLLGGCFFGAMAVMLIYNFFIFLSLRDRNYLYYIIDIFFCILFELFSKGYLIETISAEIPTINRYTFAIIVPTLFIGALFMCSFLTTKHIAPLMDRILKVYMTVLALFIPALVIVPPEACRPALALVMLGGTVMVLGTAVVCLRRGSRQARYLVGAHLFRALGVISLALGVNHLLPHTFLTSFSFQMGSLAYVVFIAFALADNINVMRREKEAAQTEAIRASQLAGIGELAAGVAHEINTPVNTILVCAGLILEDDDRKATERDAEVIVKQSRRIAAIVKSLLFFTRLPDQEKVPYAVSDLLQGTLDLIGATLSSHNITIENRILPGLKDVPVHPQQIEQVFLNIIKNSIDALDEQRGAACNRKRIEVDAGEIVVNNRSYLRIQFLDNGIGIPDAMLGSVKESFVTTKKTGTGLGLSISRQIISEHGGNLEIESKAGEYTKVIIDLPL